MVNSGAALGALLSGMLLASPARLLLIGQQTDALAIALRAEGHNVVVAPLSEPLAFAQSPSATRQGVYQVDLLLPPPDTPGFDAAIVTDVSPQIHPLSLFDQLSHCVSQDGLVLLAGQDPADIPARLAQWLEYVVAIGARCGFVPLELDSGAVVGAGAGAFVRAFRKSTPPRWQLRHLRLSDYSEVAGLFQEVFGHALSPALWAWKYGNGRGNAVLASRDGALVAHYGGMYREILLCGTPDWALGICDVMVHPNERGVMTRRGPFLLTAATSAELYGPLGFGFPNERAMLVAEKMGLYAKAGQMAEVRWEPSKPGPRLRTRVQALARDSSADQMHYESLWVAMAHDLRQSVVCVRDWKYLQHRYFDHPHNRYDILAVASRLTGKALGVVVLHRLEGSCELMDVIAPLDNLPLVIDQARRMVARWSLPYLYCWITAQFAPTFVACGGQEHPLNVFIPTSCWTDDPRVDRLKDKWWLMSGDTDFR